MGVLQNASGVKGDRSICRRARFEMLVNIPDLRNVPSLVSSVVQSPLVSRECNNSRSISQGILEPDYSSLSDTLIIST